MKKIVASFAAGFLLAGTVATSVSAQSHNVEEGDTLDSIAANHDTTVASLQDVNDLDTTLIQPGDTLEIDGDLESDQAQYKVQEGDTLSSISKEFDASVSDLKTWNDLDSDLIVVDQTINVEQIDAANPEEEPAVDDQANQEAAEVGQEEVMPTEDQTNAAEEEQEDNQAAVDQEEGSDEESADDNAGEEETMTMSATAYTADCDECSGTTANGTDLNGDEDVIAVDPEEIPLGSEVHVEGYGDAVAADTGGAINGDKIDLHMEDKEDANAFGNQEVEVTVKD